jgi:hypothetical protein
MSIEDRVRRVLAEAVADEPPLRGAPLDHALRRRSRRPVLAGAVAMALVLAAVVALAVVRGPSERPLPSTVSTKGWKTYTDVAGNLRFRYPPDWRVKVYQARGGGPDWLTLVPPGIADPAMPPAAFEVSWRVGRNFWIGENWVSGGTTSLGRLPNGRPYLRAVSRLDSDHHFASWSIDWGRPCRTGAARCVPHSVGFGIRADNGRLWDRHRAVAETIPTTVEQLRPTAPTVGDLGLPACDPDQWRLVWMEEWGVIDGFQGIVLQGGVRYRQGPRCHLRLTLRLAVEGGGGRLLPVAGNPATTTVEGDLPVDGLQRLSGSWVIDGAFMWRFMWHEWCNRGLPKATLRVTADGGASLTVPGMDPAEKRFPQGRGPASCQDRGRASTVAGWPR